MLSLLFHFRASKTSCFGFHFQLFSPCPQVPSGLAKKSSQFRSHHLILHQFLFLLLAFGRLLYQLLFAFLTFAFLTFLTSGGKRVAKFRNVGGCYVLKVKKNELVQTIVLKFLKETMQYKQDIHSPDVGVNTGGGRGSTLSGGVTENGVGPGVVGEGVGDDVGQSVSKG